MPLIESGSKKAFKKNVETEMKANPGKSNMSKNLAIAYSTKRANMKKPQKMAQGGMVTGCIACASMKGACDQHRVGEYDTREEDSLPTRSPGDYSDEKALVRNKKASNKDLPEREREAHYAAGGQVQLDPAKLASVSKGFKGALGIKKENDEDESLETYAEGGQVDDLHDLTPYEKGQGHALEDKMRMYAEGGEVDDRRPLKTNPNSPNPELEDSRQEMDSPSYATESSEESSDSQEDLPRVSESLSLIEDILNDRRRRSIKMAHGGQVGEDGAKTDEPNDMYESNNADELDAPIEDGRWQRGLNLEPVHSMSDPEHDVSDASLVEQILKDRKNRRR